MDDFRFTDVFNTTKFGISADDFGITENMLGTLDLLYNIMFCEGFVLGEYKNKYTNG